MKRFVFASALFAGLICFNIFCLCVVSEIKSEATGKLDLLYASVLEENFEKTLSECEKFTGYWLSEHHVLSQIVRHDLLDKTTVAVSGLVPLAQFHEYGELASEINRCKILIEEIWDSEIPYLRNIF